LTIAADFENPALFEADARTRIEPAASSIGTAGVKPGARVQVAFDSLAPKTASGAYTLTRFVVVSRAGRPDCTNGSPLMDIARFPQGTTHGLQRPKLLSEAPTQQSVTSTFFRTGHRPETRSGCRWHGHLHGYDPSGRNMVHFSCEVRALRFIRGDSHLLADAGVIGKPRFSTARPDRSAAIPGGRAPTAAEVTATQVEAGMPAGAAIFAATDPKCVLSPDGASFRCTLSRAPAPEISNFLDAKEPLAIGEEWPVGASVSTVAGSAGTVTSVRTPWTTRSSEGIFSESPRPIPAGLSFANRKEGARWFTAGPFVGA